MQKNRPSLRGLDHNTLFFNNPLSYHIISYHIISAQLSLASSVLKEIKIYKFQRDHESVKRTTSNGIHQTVSFACSGLLASPALLTHLLSKRLSFGVRSVLPGNRLHLTDPCNQGRWAPLWPRRCFLIFMSMKLTNNYGCWLLFPSFLPSFLPSFPPFLP